MHLGDVKDVGVGLLLGSSKIQTVLEAGAVRMARAFDETLCVIESEGLLRGAARVDGGACVVGGERGGA